MTTLPGDPGGEPDAAALAGLAGLLADRTRATFCLALLDGRAWTARELAVHAGVAASTASEHLDKLIGGGLLVEHRQGRHRYVSLAGPPVASLLEDLRAHLGPAPAPRPTLRAVTRAHALAAARTCYDHLAGRLGVRLTAAMCDRGLLDVDAGCSLTAAGLAWFGDELGIAPAALRDGRRPVARACLDWTERRPHLAGSAGAQLCSSLLDRGWVVRVGATRAVRVTPDGVDGLRALLDVDVTAPVAPSR